MRFDELSDASGIFLARRSLVFLSSSVPSTVMPAVGPFSAAGIVSAWVLARYSVGNTGSTEALASASKVAQQAP